MLNTQLVNVDADIEKLYRKQLKEELSVANQLHMATKYVHIHFSDIMNDGGEYASKSRLLSWLNDYERKGVVKRVGIVNRYKLDRPHHFDGGKWNATYFAEFIAYMVNEFEAIQNKKVREDFMRSLKSREWFDKAIAVAGMKLLLNLYDNNALTSFVARATIHNAVTSQKMLEKMGGISGRVAKYGAFGNELESMKMFMDDYFKTSFKNTLKALECHDEWGTYRKHEKLITGNIDMVFNQNFLSH